MVPTNTFQIQSSHLETQHKRVRNLAGLHISRHAEIHFGWEPKSVQSWDLGIKKEIFTWHLTVFLRHNDERKRKITLTKHPLHPRHTQPQIGKYHRWRVPSARLQLSPLLLRMMKKRQRKTLNILCIQIHFVTFPVVLSTLVEGSWTSSSFLAVSSS